jgi:hypothetical protein
MRVRSEGNQMAEVDREFFIAAQMAASGELQPWAMAEQAGVDLDNLFEVEEDHEA